MAKELKFIANFRWMCMEKENWLDNFGKHFNLFSEQVRFVKDSCSLYDMHKNLEALYYIFHRISINFINKCFKTSYEKYKGVHLGELRYYESSGLLDDFVKNKIVKFSKEGIIIKDRISDDNEHYEYCKHFRIDDMMFIVKSIKDGMTDNEKYLIEYELKDFLDYYCFDFKTYYLMHKEFFSLCDIYLEFFNKGFYNFIDDSIPKNKRDLYKTQINFISKEEPSISIDIINKDSDLETKTFIGDNFVMNYTDDEILSKFDWSEVMKNIFKQKIEQIKSKRTKIICGFPGIGKTYAFEYLKEQNPKLKVSDSDSRNFTWIEKDGNKVKNPNFVKDYMEHISKLYSENYDYIFVSTHPEVLKAIYETYDLNDYAFVIPNSDRKDEFNEIYTKREDSFKDFILENWDDLLKSILKYKERRVDVRTIFCKECFLQNELHRI